MIGENQKMINGDFHKGNVLNFMFFKELWTGIRWLESVTLQIDQKCSNVAVHGIFSARQMLLEYLRGHSATKLPLPRGEFVHIDWTRVH